MRLSITLLFLIFYAFLFSQPSQSSIHRVLAEVNLLRSSGHQCGDNWMTPVGPVVWNKELHIVSSKYAKYMSANRHFDHVSKSGKDLGDRLDRMGYQWSKIGENLGYGYTDFYTVMKAWLESPSHCEMLMDGEMTDIGLSKHKLYWAMSFSKSPQHLAELSFH